MFRGFGFAVCCLAALSVIAARADEPVDPEMVTKIRYEGFHRSQVMETLEYLADTIGPRLTKSPAMLAANEWTRDRLASWGLRNAVNVSREIWTKISDEFSCASRFTVPAKGTGELEIFQIEA